MRNETVVCGLSLAEWSEQRQRLDAGLRRTYPELRGLVGIIVVMLNGRDMFIGCATEYRRRGYAKRLADFTRPSASGRNYHAGWLIREHVDQVAVDIIPTGSDRAAAQVAKELKRALLAAGKPPWNVRVRLR